MKCPECSSTMVKAGFRVVNRKGDKKQQWICTNKKCNRRTLNPIREETE